MRHIHSINNIHDNSFNPRICKRCDTRGLAADDVLIEATATSSSAAKYEPNAVVGEDTEPLSGGDQDTVSAAYDAVVLLGYTVQLPASWMQGICMKNNPNIIYVKQ